MGVKNGPLAKEIDEAIAKKIIRLQSPICYMLFVMEEIFQPILKRMYQLE